MGEWCATSLAQWSVVREWSGLTSGESARHRVDCDVDTFVNPVLSGLTASLREVA
jgi:hypothetical protein